MKKTTHFHVADNSNAFQDWLKEQGIEYTPNGHFTSIPLTYDIFKIGMQWEKYRSNNPSYIAYLSSLKK